MRLGLADAAQALALLQQAVQFGPFVCLGFSVDV
jgi:hypothetical protein